MPQDPKLVSIIKRLETSWRASIVEPVPDPLCKVCEGSGKIDEPTDPPSSAECACFKRAKDLQQQAAKQTMFLLLNNMARILRALKAD